MNDYHSEHIFLTILMLLIFDAGNKYLVEVDRLLRPGGYFVWTDPLTNSQRSLSNKANLKRWNTVQLFAESLCWDMLPQQDETVVWKKTSKKNCYSKR